MRHRRLALLFAFALAAVTAGVAFAGATPTVAPNEFAPNQEVNRPTPAVNTGYAAPRVIPAHSTSVTYDTSGSAFGGLTLADTRSADGGNAYSIEPPDQGLCTNGTWVLEPVNDAFAIYRASDGAMVRGPKSLNSFFTGDVAIDRTNAPDYTFGQFLSDPKCYWDPGNGHWYFTVLQINTDPVSGDFEQPGHSTVLIAVSKGTNPTTTRSDWWFYALDTTNDGGAAHDRSTGTQAPARTLPTDEGCPCFGDQPLIGADQYGFYVSTNEYPIFNNGFNGAQIYAFDKNALTNGIFKMQYVLHSNFTGTGWSPDLEGGYIYSVQPATSPTTGSWDTSNDGTEYFLSALDFDGTTDNRVAAWAMTNTSSLATATPDVQLEDYAIVDSEVYGQPPAIRQKPGFTPLAHAFKAHEATIESNDDRMNQVVYADGKLYGGVNTAITTARANVANADRTGIAWFMVEPNWDSGFGASMTNEGYIALDNNDSVMFPSLGVNADGNGVMVFSLAGQHYYPSAAYALISGDEVGSVHIAGAGGMPADGFTGVPAYGGPPERWGDYSAAVALPDGSVWAATEWIPGDFNFATGGWFANWGTYVMHITPPTP